MVSWVVSARATKLGKERAMCTRMSLHPQWFDTMAAAGLSSALCAALLKLCCAL